MFRTTVVWDRSLSIDNVAINAKAAEMNCLNFAFTATDTEFIAMRDWETEALAQQWLDYINAFPVAMTSASMESLL